MFSPLNQTKNHCKISVADIAEQLAVKSGKSKQSISSSETLEHLMNILNSETGGELIAESLIDCNSHFETPNKVFTMELTRNMSVLKNTLLHFKEDLMLNSCKECLQMNSSAPLKSLPKVLALKLSQFDFRGVQNLVQIKVPLSI
jgi:uncharacterized UBP type Zn finger protein